MGEVDFMLERVDRLCREHAKAIVSKHPHEDPEYWYRRCRKGRLAIIYMQLLHSKKLATVPEWLLEELSKPL
jgi:hypothetical protein